MTSEKQSDPPPPHQLTEEVAGDSLRGEKFVKKIVTKFTSLVRMVVVVNSFNLVLWMRLIYIVILMTLIIKLMMITKKAS